MSIVSQQQKQWQFATAWGWRLLISLTTPPMIAGLGYTAYRLWRTAATDSQPTLSRILAGVVFGFAVFLLYALLEVIRWRLVLTPTHIISAGLLRTQELSFDNVRGFRVDDNYTYILPRWEGQPTIKVGYTTAGYARLQALLAERFPRLDANDMLEEAVLLAERFPRLDANDMLEEAVLLADTSLGSNATERADRLDAARRTTTALNWLSGGVAAWLVFRPQPYAWAIGVALALPVLAVIALWRHPGVLRIDEHNNSVYPSVAWALLLPSLALLWRSANDAQFITYAPLWPKVGTVATIMTVLLIAGNRYFLRQRATRLNTIVAAAICGLFYSFGSTVGANAAFDQAPGILYHPQVRGKHSSSGTSNTYYLTVTAWGPLRRTDDVVVSSSYYRRAQLGDTITVRLNPGWLHIPWHTVIE